MLKTIFYIAFLGSAIISIQTNAQPFPDLKFSSLSVRDGLKSNAIRCIFEDSRGIIWIGTEGGGLNRYSATGIRVYKRNSDDNSAIPGNTINSIVEDEDGHLWLGTNNGLAHFNPLNGKSENILPEPGVANSLASMWVSGLLLKDKDDLIVSTANGVQLYNIRQKKFITLKVPPRTHPRYQDGYMTFGLVKKDKQGRFWVLHRLGMYQVDFNTKSLIFYDQQEEISITNFYQDESGDIYLSFWPGGVKKFIPKTNQYKTISTANGKPDKRIASSITEWADNAGHKWLCMGFAGEFVLRDRQTGVTKEYVYDKKDPYCYNLNLVSTILVDRQNRLWLGADNGLHIIDPALQNFTNISLYQQLNMVRPQDFGIPSSFFKTSSDYYFTVWHGRGLYKADKNWNITKENTTRIHKPSPIFNDQRINNFYIDKNNNRWFATDSGLVKQTGNKVKLYTLPGARYFESGDNVVSNIIPRSDGLLWLRARVAGIFLFDPATEKFIKHFKQGERGLSEHAIGQIFLDSNQRLWTGNEKNIYYYDEANDNFREIPVNDSRGKTVNPYMVSSYAESPDRKILWAATTNSGLVKIDRRQNTGLQITRRDGLYEDALYRVKTDTTGKVWISSPQGLIRYDDDKKRFSFFNYESGLPYLFDNWGIFDFDLEGNLLMSNSGAITRFNPYTFKQNNAVADVVLLDVTVQGKAISAEDKIELRPGTNNVAIHFDITNYTAPRLNRYFYRMDNQENWQEVDGGSVFFGSLPHGRYHLRLKGINNEGIETKEKLVSINILPFWYETLLFKLLAVAAIAGVLYYIARTRIKNIRKESELKQKLGETEMKALRSQMNPHFIFNCLNSIELYTAQNNSEAATYYLSKFSRLIRLVLDNSKSDRISLEQELETLELYLEMEKMRFKEKLQYQISVNENVEADFIEIPPMLIQPYVENAIWHGIMHKAAGGNISVNVSLKEDQEQILKVEIIDDGVGRAKAAALKSKSATKQKSYGMKITSERMNMLNEMYKITTTINVEDLYNESRQPKGTKVTIEIPV